MRSVARRGAVMAGVLAMALAVASPAFAGPPPAAETTAPDHATERRWREACTGDAFDFCALAALSGHRDSVYACLVKHLPHISAACRALIEGDQVREKAGEAERQAAVPLESAPEN